MPTQYEPDNNHNFMQPDQMSDEAIWDLLSVYADGEATPEEAARVEALQHRQPSITGELAFLRRTTDAVRTLAEVEPPYSLRTAIYAATTQRPTLARRIGNAWQRICPSFAAPSFRYTLAGGACAAAGLAALLLLPHGHPGNHSPVNPAVKTVVAFNNNSKSQSSVAPPVQREKPQTPTIRLAIPTKLPASRSLVQNTLRHSVEHADNGHADEILLTTLGNMERQSARMALNSAKQAHTVNAKKGLIRPQLAALRDSNTQKIGKVDQNVADNQSSQFSPRPKMDQEYQRVTLAMVSNKGSDDSLGANIDSSHDAPTPAPPVVSAADNAGGVDNAPKHVIHVSLSQLPPDARHYLTTADIKKELDARNLGFSRTTLEGIKRSEATVALIGGKF
jgi:hypothetical protein